VSPARLHLGGGEGYRMEKIKKWFISYFREFKDFFKLLIGLLKNKESNLMSLQHFLAKPSVLKKMCVTVAVVLLLLGNYLINTVLQIPNLLKGTASFGLQHLFSFRIFTHFWIYLILFGFITFICFRLYYLARVSFKDNNVGQKGTARFAKRDEIEEQYKSIHRIDEKHDYMVDGRGGIPIAYDHKKERIFFETDATNTLVIGQTRSGKGELFVKPMIDIVSRTIEKSSMVISDPKLELCESFYGTLIERGYDVRVLNLVNLEHSMGYNPLQEITRLYIDGRRGQAEELCRSFAYSFFNSENVTQEKFWTDSATLLLSALIISHVEDCVDLNVPEKVTLASISDLFTELTSRPAPGRQDKTMLDLYFEARPMGSVAKAWYSGYNAAADRTKGGISSTMLTKLTFFKGSSIERMTAKTNINMADIGFGDKPMAIFISAPDYNAAYHFIASVFIRQVYFILAEAATKKGGKCPRHVDFILDEFGNMPIIENMGSIVTVCLGRNMSFHLFVQELDQLKRYDKDEKTILSNCGNFIYIKAKEIDTLEKVSKMLGNETVTNITRMGGHLDLTKNYTEMQEEKPLMFAEQLANLQIGESVVIRSMKRVNLKGEPITAHPISNVGEHRMPMQYTYNSHLAARAIIADELPISEVDNVNAQEFILDIQMLFKKMLNELPDKKESSSGGASADKQLTPISKTDFKATLGNYPALLEELYEHVNHDRAYTLESVSNMTAEQLMVFFEQQAKDEIITARLAEILCDKVFRVMNIISKER